jgi:hypothetical protein
LIDPADRMSAELRIRGPEPFYSVRLQDELGFYPVADLLDWPDGEAWPTALCLQWAMGSQPRSFTIIQGFGILNEDEDFWVFGKTPEEALSVSHEWIEED